MKKKFKTVATTTLIALGLVAAGCSTMKVVQRPDASKCRPTNSLYGGMCAVSCLAHGRRTTTSIPGNGEFHDGEGGVWRCQDYSLARVAGN